MPITEFSRLKQIELALDDSGGLRHVFVERVNIVDRDGAVIAQGNHRDSFDASSPEGQAVLGEALAAAVAGLQAAQAERDAARGSLAQAIAELEALRPQVAELAAQVAALQPKPITEGAQP